MPVKRPSLPGQRRSLGALQLRCGAVPPRLSRFRAAHRGAGDPGHFPKPSKDESAQEDEKYADEGVRVRGAPGFGIGHGEGIGNAAVEREEGEAEQYEGEREFLDALRDGWGIELGTGRISDPGRGGSFGCWGVNVSDL